MPAVIDTGGPRALLHCVERADCPRSSSIVSFSCPAYRSFSNRQETCPVVAEHRSTTQLASSGDQRCLHGNDERNEFFLAERSPPISSTSSNDLGFQVARDRKGRKRCSAQHRLGRRRSFLGYEIDREKEIIVSSHNHVPEINEITRDEVVEACPVDETRQRSSTICLVEESTTGTSACNLNSVKCDDHRERLVRESSAIVMRLFDGCGVEREFQPMYRTIERSSSSSAATSSQRTRPTEVTNEFGSEIHHHRRQDNERKGDYCVDYGCKCDASRALKNCVNATRERRKRHKSYQQKGRSYLQLALLLFLAAFGHNSLVKTSIVGFGGKTGIGTGLGALTIGTIVGTVGALPVDLDGGVRAERSANLSHITGASRKIQMYIKNRHLQILPDGTVNGSNDDTSEYTIFQRTSVSRGQLRIQGVATCLYLCMDSCGLLYGSRESTEDCVFNETLEQHNYNTYSSVRWSTAKKTLYLGLNRRGQPRRVQAKGHNLGRLSAYARVLTQVAPPDRVEALHSRMLGAQHNLRHHHNSHHHRNMQQVACPNLPPQEKDGRDKFRCRKRKKRKKRKRPCNDGEKPGPHCEIVEEHASHRGTADSSGEGPQSKRSCEGAASEELCRRQALDAPAKKRKLRIESSKKNPGTKENQQDKQQKMQSRKEVKPKKIVAGKKSNSGGANTDEDQPRRSNGPNGKRKKPSSRLRTPLARKKNNTGRVTRTTLLPANPTIVVTTLPSSWYPGLSTTTPSDISLGRRTKNPITSINAVTSETLKISDSQSSRNGKAIGSSDLLSDNSTLESSTENPQDHYSSVFGTSFDDSSMETSDEARSDEFNQDDDPTTSSSSEYSTLMTTMDTTPPERTEDYTRATTESIEVGRGRPDNDEDSTTIERSRKFSRELRLPVGRLVM